MGLDMYLQKKIYVGAEYEHRQVKGKVAITVNGKPLKINFNKISEITERVAYWRKANQIHSWFVKNCQGGVDDCRDAYVSEEKLKELLAECKKIKKNKAVAGEILPPQEGFFFGGTEIDDYYMQDIKYTIDVIEEILADKSEGKGEIYYHSSW
jgi:hypothetical protein